jgi:hypothetical protein
VTLLCGRSHRNKNEWTQEERSGLPDDLQTLEPGEQSSPGSGWEAIPYGVSSVAVMYRVRSEVGERRGGILVAYILLPVNNDSFETICH